MDVTKGIMDKSVIKVILCIFLMNNMQTKYTSIVRYKRIGGDS